MTHPNREFAIDVVRRLQTAGHEALWAGGCVRDQLLGLDPKDYDVATSAVPDQVRAVFGKSRTWAVGEAFGVIVVRGPRGVDQIEVATFRIDGGYSDGRRPDSVTFSSAEEDARRRDFTINGIFFDPLTERIIDFVDGQSDLKKGIVRAIGDPHARFDDDKLRMLRAIRFAARFAFELDPETLAAIQRRPGDIHVVSGERLGHEMSRMLTGVHCQHAMELLQKSRLLAEVLPESNDVLDHHRPKLFAALGELTNEIGREAALPLPLVVAMLLRDWSDSKVAAEADTEVDARPLVSKVAARWKLANHDKSQIRWLLEQERKIRHAQQLPWPGVQRVLVHEDVQQLLQFASAVAVANHSADQAAERELANVTFCREKIALDPAEWNPAPLLNGDDLRKHGISPGPVFKRLLTAVRDAQLDGDVRNVEDAWALVAKLTNDE